MSLKAEESSTYFPITGGEPGWPYFPVKDATPRNCHQSLLTCLRGGEAEEEYCRDVFRECAKAERRIHAEP